MTPEEIDSLAERAAEKALTKVYADIGQSVLKRIDNGYVISLYREGADPAPMARPEEYAFPTWAELTAWLAQEGFVAGEPA